MKRTPTHLAMLILAAAAIAAGCGKDQGGTQDRAAASPPKPQFETVVVPEGTTVVATLDASLSTETNHTGDAFVATTVEPIVVGGRTVFPAGARIHGSLQDVQASGRIEGRARMTLAYQGIVDEADKTHAFSAVPLTLQAASKTHDDVEKIAAGGVLGAIVGGISGGGKGAAIGAGAGAGAGTILMLATKGDDLELAAGQRLNIQMTSATSVQVLASR
jgi:hypothetical protein